MKTREGQLLTCPGCGISVITSCKEYRCTRCGVHVTECDRKCCPDLNQQRSFWLVPNERQALGK